jgi:hypothetical protein
MSSVSVLLSHISLSHTQTRTQNFTEVSIDIFIFRPNVDLPFRIRYFMKNYLLGFDECDSWKYYKLTIYMNSTIFNSRVLISLVGLQVYFHSLVPQHQFRHRFDSEISNVCLDYFVELDSKLSPYLLGMLNIVLK